MTLVDNWQTRIRHFPKLVWFLKWVRCRSRFAPNRTTRRGRDNLIEYNWIIANGLRVIIRGNGNSIRVGHNTILTRSTIRISGTNNSIEIGENCVLDRTEFCIEDSGCKISLGPRTTIGGAHLAATEDGSTIEIGEDCMFARGIEVRTGDSHAIFNSVGVRINQAQSVSIGNHVWVGMYSSILKGAQIGDGAIVSTKSLVTKGFFSPNSIIAGVPAKIVKNKIKWTRERRSMVLGGERSDGSE